MNFPLTFVCDLCKSRSILSSYICGLNEHMERQRTLETSSLLTPIGLNSYIAHTRFFNEPAFFSNLNNLFLIFSFAAIRFLLPNTLPFFKVKP